MIKYFTILSLLLLFAYSLSASASDFYVFPANGQSQEQQEKDEFECYTWAKKQTNFDPMNVPMASSPPPAQDAPKGGVLRGAAVGGIVGEIADDKGGEGAAIGAVLGGMRRRNQVSQQNQEQQNWEQEQTSQYAAQRNNYNRAFGACLEGKGYNIK
jgi:hypothetical protein